MRRHALRIGLFPELPDQERHNQDDADFHVCFRHFPSHIVGNHVDDLSPRNRDHDYENRGRSQLRPTHVGRWRFQPVHDLRQHD